MVTPRMDVEPQLFKNSTLHVALRVALENRLSSNYIQINMPLKLSKKCLRCHCFNPLHAKMLKNADLCIGITHIKLLDLH